MPRLTEIQELLNNCSGSVSTYNGVKGMTVTGQNGNSIFLPAAGYYSGAELHDNGGQMPFQKVDCDDAMNTALLARYQQGFGRSRLSIILILSCKIVVIRRMRRTFMKESRGYVEISDL